MLATMLWGTPTFIYICGETSSKFWKFERRHVHDLCNKKMMTLRLDSTNLKKKTLGNKSWYFLNKMFLENIIVLVQHFPYSLDLADIILFLKLKSHHKGKIEDVGDIKRNMMAWLHTISKTIFQLRKNIYQR